jgi:hypothetical protein
MKFCWSVFSVTIVVPFSMFNVYRVFLVKREGLKTADTERTAVNERQGRDETQFGQGMWYLIAHLIGVPVPGCCWWWNHVPYLPPEASLFSEYLILKSFTCDPRYHRRNADKLMSAPVREQSERSEKLLPLAFHQFSSSGPEAKSFWKIQRQNILGRSAARISGCRAAETLRRNWIISN